MKSMYALAALLLLALVISFVVLHLWLGQATEADVGGSIVVATLAWVCVAVALAMGSHDDARELV